MKRKKKSKPPRRTWPEGFRPVERVRGRKGYNRAKAKRETITEEQADAGFAHFLEAVGNLRRGEIGE